MPYRLEVQTARETESMIYLYIDDNDVTTLTGIEAAERMLVDSDSLSFIYILETSDEFIYVSLPKSVWPSLKKAMDEQYDVILNFSNTEDTITLTNLNEELDYLVSNIDGNANYGKEMVEAVEEIFQK